VLARPLWLLLARRRYPGWREFLARIRATWALDAPTLAARQEAALAAHLAWARDTIPYWRERAPGEGPLAAWPVLTRSEVQAHEEALRDPTRPVASLRRETSGGSTGTPVAVWQDDAYHTWDFATEAHVLETWGIEPWAPSAFLWGADRDLSDLPGRERLYIRLLRRELVNAFRMGEPELRDAQGRLERLQPVYLQGYASALELFARWLQTHAPDHGIRPRAIRSSAETLRPEARALIQATFHAKVYDFYGSRESASIAVECPAGSLHVQAHARVVELVDDENRPVGAGETGRLLVTDLTNRAFGLIRYDTGDIATWTEAGACACACGCAYPRLERIHGRTSDFISTPQGERIHGEWFTHLFYGRDDVERFQVHQTSLDRVEVRTVGTATEADLAPLLAGVRERMGEGVVVAWANVDAIAPTASGKHRFTLSDVPYLPEAK
jgi:phenylacetate-CoA ligase